jgi:hypothetical protein
LLYHFKKPLLTYLTYYTNVQSRGLEMKTP